VNGKSPREYITTEIRTIKRFDQTNDKEIRALLYVPRLDEDADGCYKQAKIPPYNITTDTRNYNVDAVALFPFISKKCTTRFLETIVADGMSTSAAVMYPLWGGYMDTDLAIDDDDERFRVDYKPYNIGIYAINASTGQELMDDLSTYSQPIKALQGTGLTAYNPDDFVGITLKIELREWIWGQFWASFITGPGLNLESD